MAEVSNNYFRNLLGAVAAVLLALVGFSYALPLHFWGVHFPTFLAAYVGPLLFVVPMLGAVALHFGEGRLAPLARVPSWVWSLGIAGLMWYLYYHLYSETRLYGDSKTILMVLGEDATVPHGFTIAGAFNPQILSSKNGEGFTYGLTLGVQAMFGCTIWGAFRILTAAIGAVYAFVWVDFVLAKLKTPVVRLLAIAIGLLGGMSQVFYGHVEVYAAPMLLFTGYFIALVHYLERREDKWLLATGMLLLLSIRAHSLAFAFVPTFGYALLARLGAGKPKGETWLRWNRGGGLLLGGPLAVGMLAYMTIFKAGAEKVAKDGSGRNTFLMLTSDKSEGNLYAMFSGWHLWDFLQEALLISMPACGLLVALIAVAWKGERWNRPSEIALAMALALSASLIFAVDPWLSMPRDWDLCGLFAPPLLLMSVIFLARHETRLRQAWLPLALLTGLAALQLSAELLSHNKKQVHERILENGKHAFMTRQIGSSFMLRHALGSGAFTVPEHRARLKDALDFMDKHKVKSQSSEVAFLSQYAGNVYWEAGDLPAAEQYFTQAATLEPMKFQFYAQLAAVESSLGKHDKALQYARNAIVTGNKSPAVWAIAIRSAIAQHQETLALQIATDFRTRYGDPLSIVPELQAIMPSATPDSLGARIP